VLVDPGLAENVAKVREETAVTGVLPLRDEVGSLVERCAAGPVPELDVAVADDDLVQLLYTSGTTSQPKGAMMTHRALLHEYLSCVTALDFSADDRPLRSEERRVGKECRSRWVQSQ